MKVKKSYFKKEQFSLDISKRKAVVGVFFGLLFSIIFYSFLKIISKLFIVFDALFKDYEILIQTEKSALIYNFLLAFIAIYFSFSVVFNFFLERPKKFLSKYNYKRQTILNQQRLSNWYFLGWFFRMGILIGLLALDYESSSFLKDYSFLIVLFFIVFLGQIWISVRNFFIKNKFKWFLVTVFTSLLLTFLISKIEVINDDVINKSILSQNILFKNSIKRVNSNIYEPLPYYRSLIFNIYLKETKNDFFIETDKYFPNDKKSVKDKIRYYKTRISKAEEPFLNYILYINKNLKMKHVVKFKSILKKEKANNIYYSIANKELPFYHKSDRVFGFSLNSDYSEEIENQTLKIKFISENKYIFQKDTLLKADLKKSIKERIDAKGLSPFVLAYKSETRFEDYFVILSMTKEVVNEYRNDYALKSYGEEYFSLSKMHRKPIMEKFYWSFIDVIE